MQYNNIRSRAPGEIWWMTSKITKQIWPIYHVLQVWWLWSQIFTHSRSTFSDWKRVLDRYWDGAIHQQYLSCVVPCTAKIFLEAFEHYIVTGCKNFYSAWKWIRWDLEKLKGINYLWITNMKWKHWNFTKTLRMQIFHLDSLASFPPQGVCPDINLLLFRFTLSFTNWIKQVPLIILWFSPTMADVERADDALKYVSVCIFLK